MDSCCCCSDALFTTPPRFIQEMVLHTVSLSPYPHQCRQDISVGIVLIRLTWEVNRLHVAHCGRHHSLSWDPRLYIKGREPNSRILLS